MPDLRYLYSPDSVDALLSHYPALRACAAQVAVQSSSAHPSSTWKVARTRFGAFLAQASLNDDPHPRLRQLEAGVAAGPTETLASTRCEDQFIPAVARQLVLAALADVGFHYRELPHVEAGRKKSPDVMGDLPGVGSVSIEVFQPADDRALTAYAAELHDAFRLADLPWSYCTGLSWQRPRIPLHPGAKVPMKLRHARINALLEEARARLQAAEDTQDIELTFTDDVGLRCTVNLTGVEPWISWQAPPWRPVCQSWLGPGWNSLFEADRVAERLARKGSRRQAQGRAADLHALIVDCGALIMSWDISITPHAPTVASLRDAIEKRRDTILAGLDGIVVWAPHILPGDERRLVGWMGEVPAALLSALQGSAADGSASR